VRASPRVGPRSQLGLGTGHETALKHLRTGTLPSVNPRQRRAVLLLILSFIGLVAVFFLVSGYVADVRREVDPKVTVLALKTNAQPFKQITDGMVEEKEMPERYAPTTALTERGQIVGFQPKTELTKGSILQEGMLATPQQLEEGQRELAILVSAETGVAGKIQSGDYVDIIGTFQGEREGDPNQAEVVVPEARIIDVGKLQVRGGDDQEGTDPSQVVPVTFALTPREALQVEYAESFATEVRLALRRAGDAAELKRSERKYQRAPAERRKR
jgi:pilus assembly protein CpaB